MIIRTEAVVLRSMEYGETSRIVTLFTREKGKITVIAKGARHPKSRFGSTLQPMAYTQVVFYYKPSRTLQNLTESAYVEPFIQIGKNLERITIGLRLVELVSALLQEEERSPIVFDLLLQVLHRLNGAPVHASNLLAYFQLRLAAVLGFSPDIDRELVAQVPESGGVLALDSGAVLPAATAASRAARRASRTGLRAFAIAARADVDDVLRMRLEPEHRIELGQLVEDYLRYHVEDAYPRRSNAVIGQLVTHRSDS